jgi:hypothetical protein
MWVHERRGEGEDKGREFWLSNGSSMPLSVVAPAEVQVMLGQAKAQGPSDSSIVILDNTIPVFALAKFATGRERERERERTREWADVNEPLVGEKAVGGSEDACRANDVRRGGGRRRAWP